MRSVTRSIRMRSLVRAGLLSLSVSLSLVSGGAAEAFVWPNVPERIARSLASPDVSERRAAAQRIGELPSELGVPLAQRALGDPDVEVRLAAAEAAIALRLSRAGDLVIGWLGEGDARLRLAACDVIRSSPTDRSVVALGRVLGDPDSKVRVAAASAMGSSGLPDAVSPLLGHLDDSALEVRVEVARALGRLADPRAVVPLIGKVQDAVPEVRRAVARALGELGDARATSALMIALQDGSQDVRVEAVTALGKLRSDEATAAIAPLLEAGSGSDAVLAPSMPGVRPGQGSAGAGEVRTAALRALGRIGSESAVRALIGALAKDDPSAPRSPVREALVMAGKSAAPQLVAVLSGSPSPSTAAGAALVLGALGAKEGLDPTVRAMQRGVLPLKHGLRALALLGSSEALPAVLELLSDADPTVRREAIRAASELLDPARPDGRAVDPARAMLLDAATPPDEKIELVRLLGRTGSPRAHDVLLPLATTKSRAFRLAVLEALGAYAPAPPKVEAVLLDAIADDAADVRLAAAASIARAGGPSAAAKLLERLQVAAEQDRGAIGLALAGALSRATDPALAERVGAALPSSPDVARDALLEGLGRMRGEASGKVLRKFVASGIDDRRKVAEALAGHPEAATVLVPLLGDADPGVRANAAWSLGAVGKKDAVATLTRAVTDPDVAVAGNAAGALGRVAAREGAAADVQASLCRAATDPRPYVRANAVVALGLAGASCEPGLVMGLLQRDRSEAVRLAAAEAIWRDVSRAQTGKDLERRALARCAGEDRNATVANRCARLPVRAPGTDDVLVFVAPDGKDEPLARAPYALVREDGLLRMGIADRRGAFFEFVVPKGTIRLAVPAQLAR
ncbi:HEAT repeat domain-containing protein [Polyangium jinanense]|uniref:HEAT repeat domain-containing protein n=1 Tax=Polyangium jinanense TaxID=2829994 RepID=A0A9X3X5Q8_9BACT|nr:HEAT repeat domain-containing protein [Polyangium jinanense]MDC3954188.1 HEAT repeat domain-containing protein [Polyangium jinanense]MDC3981856.1 HEAT repeat domain-containing protein [Polyangium jinanense]